MEIRRHCHRLLWIDDPLLDSGLAMLDTSLQRSCSSRHGRCCLSRTI
jgi:hypothetical protein